MYVTRRLSMYEKDPSALALPPPEGPNSGILVICDDDKIRNRFTLPLDLPLPQNVNIGVQKHQPDAWSYYSFIPVVNQPLAAGLYYIINSQGNNQGYACTCSKEKEMQKVNSCVCFSYKVAKDVEARPLDPSNIYQQFCIRKWFQHFYVRSFASDGLVSKFWNYLRTFSISNSRCYSLEDALGLDHSLRECLPNFDFPLFHDRSHAVAVGKWYCPFMFVKEKNVPVANQMRDSMFYDMMLTQQWVRIFYRNSDDIKGDCVSVDVNVETEVVDVVGRGSHCENVSVVDGIAWFQGLDKETKEVLLGLSTFIIEKINWDQVRFGWVKGKGRKANIKRLEEFEGEGEWRKFGCYALVEKYILRRMDERLVLTYEFMHTDKLRCKWE